MLERLQYITQGETLNDHLSAVQRACDAGVRWVQLRVKNISESELLPIALEARNICNSYGTTFIVNDYLKVALDSKADGVHLGKEDMTVAQAKRISGNNFIVGGTANTRENIQQHVTQGADYIGLGPYRFTSTKQNLSPILGIEGYREILSKGIGVPVYAIGGITEEDVEKIMETGVHGIAVSGLITNHNNPKELIEQLNNKLNKEVYVEDSRQSI